jgi:hypothetical protein
LIPLVMPRQFHPLAAMYAVALPISFIH